MQLAILLVLILIAVILAPWLLGVIAVLVAAYGLWLAVAFALTIAAIAIGAVVLLIYFSGRGLFKKHDISSGTEQKIAEANRLFRAKEAARLAVAEQEELKYKEIMDRAKKSGLTTCKSCSASIEKHSMYCPECGKSPI